MHSTTLLMVALATAMPASGEIWYNTPPDEIARSSVGRAGERQTRDQVAADVSPMARIDTRISNRIPSRIQNRIDRDRDHQASAQSPSRPKGGP